MEINWSEELRTARGVARATGVDPDARLPVFHVISLARIELHTARRRGESSEPIATLMLRWLDAEARAAETERRLSKALETIGQLRGAHTAALADGVGA